MTQEEYLARFEQIVGEMTAITRAKNTDYAGCGDAFKNFRLTEVLGVADTARGILVRMSDKFQRICNLIDREGAVADEKVEDTLKDLANYAIITLIYLEEQARLRKPEVTYAPVQYAPRLPGRKLADPVKSVSITPGVIVSGDEDRPY